MKSVELEAEIRQLIMESVEVDGLSAEELGADTPLFGDGIGLDSIDALEIGAAIRRKYGVKFKTNSDENRANFRTIGTLARFVASHSGITIEDQP